MRILSIVFAALIVLLQYPLWLGKGGWLRVWEIDRQVKTQKEGNARLRVRNDALDAEVRDLKQGYDAVEERARYELGMIRQDEIFFHIMEKTPVIKAPEPAGAVKRE
jgi:cell division protein FtsB